MKCIRFFLICTFLISLSVISCSSGQVDNKPAKRYLITDFGAVTDPNTVNTKAIQDAIDKCAADGGGTLVVPAGTYITGAIFFKQGVNLEIGENGVLKGTTNMADYKLVQTRWEGEERIWVSALVNVFDMTGFRMFGKGTIDGSGDIWFPSRGRGGFGGFGGFGAGAGGANETQPESVKNVGPIREGPPSLGVKGGLPATPDSPFRGRMSPRLQMMETPPS